MPSGHNGYYLCGASACGDLEALISDHHSTFMELYPHASITMKMQYAKTFVGVSLMLMFVYM